MTRVLAACLVVAAAASLGARDAQAKGSPGKFKPPDRDDPIGAPIRDVPTTIAIPISGDRSLVLGLAERFWIQCPRWLPGATSLAGDGVIAQYINLRGGTVSLLYAGSVALDAPREGETHEARAARAASEFAGSLADHYAKVDFHLTTGAVGLEAVPLRLDGKKVPAWRTARYAVTPALAYGGPRSVYTGECLLFSPPGIDRLAYVALDAKGGGTTLAKATDHLSVRPTREANAEARRVQLLDIAEALDTSRFPVRLVAFDVPAGFTVTRRILGLGIDWVWAEERLDETGAVNAVLRMRQTPNAPGHLLAEDLQTELAVWKESERGPVETVPLAVKGQSAYVFSHASPRDSPTARSHTALFRLDDMSVALSWITLGDAAQAERDRAGLVALVRSIDMTTRW